jgi:hypothetical protein
MQRMVVPSLRMRVRSTPGWFRCLRISHARPRQGSESSHIAADKKAAPTTAASSKAKRKAAPESEPELSEEGSNKENAGKKPKTLTPGAAEVKTERQDGRAFRTGTQNVSYKDATAGRIKAESYEVVKEETCATEAEALSATGGSEGPQVRRCACCPSTSAVTTRSLSTHVCRFCARAEATPVALAPPSCSAVW